MINSIHGIKIGHATYDGFVDDHENLYIDFTSGIFANNIGNFNKQVCEAIKSQLMDFSHCYTYGAGIRDTYLQALCEFTGYEAAYMFSAGTEATEAAWKIARHITGKEGIWGLSNAFHGKTFGAQIMAGRQGDWRSQTPGEKTGALIFEPYEAATAQFRDDKIIQRIIDLKKEFGLLLIADEIQAGFGRTGRLFGYQHYQERFPELKPDMVTIGKAMTNGFPASAVLGPADLINNPLMELSSTNGGHPLACAAGLATIRYFKDHHVIERAAEMGKYFHKRLSELPCPTQGRGMVASLWFDSVTKADQVVMDCCNAGLLVVHTGKSAIKLGPPLTIEKEHLDEGIEILKGVV